MLLATINSSIILIALDIFRRIDLDPLTPANTNYLLRTTACLLVGCASVLTSERPLVAPVHVEQSGPHAHGLQAREVRQYGVRADPEREQVEPIRPRHERVRLLASEM